jgi:hypothetical protein
MMKGDEGFGWIKIAKTGTLDIFHDGKRELPNGHATTRCTFNLWALGADEINIHYSRRVSQLVLEIKVYSGTYCKAGSEFNRN